jgi:hypothetical protein
MPYLHWELEDARKEMSSIIKELQKSNKETLDNLYYPAMVLSESTMSFY